MLTNVLPFGVVGKLIMDTIVLLIVPGLGP